MAVRQLGGPTGSVVAYVEVPDFTKDRLAMSGLVLAAGEPSRIGSSSVTIGWPSPTTRRHFMRTDRITAHAEVYSDDRTPDTGVLATVTTSGGTRIHTAPAALVANSPGRARYSASLPLADLTPGDYILQLEARTGRRSATRQVLFSMIAE